MIKFHNLIIQRRIIGDDFHLILSFKDFLNSIRTCDTLGSHHENSADRHHRIGDNRKVVGKRDNFSGFTQAAVDPPGADQNYSD